MRSLGSYILVGIWCLMAIVLAHTYAGNLFSFLSVAKLEPIINSLGELAQSKNLQVIVQDRSEMAIRFLVKNFLCYRKNLTYFKFLFFKTRAQLVGQRK